MTTTLTEKYLLQTQSAIVVQHRIRSRYHKEVNLRMVLLVQYYTGWLFEQRKEIWGACGERHGFIEYNCRFRLFFLDLSDIFPASIAEK